MTKPADRIETARPHRFRRYPDYKESGVDWLREVPAHWEMKRLKAIAAVQLSNVDKHSEEGQVPVKLCNYVDVYYNDFITAELDFMNATATPDQARRFRLRVGDVLITKDSESWTDIAVPAVVAEDLADVLCGYHLAHIRPAPGLDGRFLARQFAAIGARDQFHVAANGITRFGLGGDAIRGSLFAVPPMDEQRAIAAFLDRETAKIDALVERKERLIELLQEKRTALITRAVTRGLDPNVLMKDSGVEWLGWIPTHWEVCHLRRVVSKFVDYRGKTPEKSVSGVPLVTARNIKNQSIDFSLSEEFIPEELYPRWMVRGRPERGDVVITTEAPLGETAQVVDTGIALAQRVILLKVDATKIINDYLKYHFAADSGRMELRTRATGSTALGIKASHLKSSLIPVPLMCEQDEISRTVRSESEEVDVLIAKVREAIDQLREFRAALISAAVTGKIDVREVVLR